MAEEQSNGAGWVFSVKKVLKSTAVADFWSNDQ